MSSKPPQPHQHDLAEASTELRISTGLQDTIAAAPVDPDDPDNPFDEATVEVDHSAKGRWARGSGLATPGEAKEEIRLGNYRVVLPISAGRSGWLHLGEHALLRYRVAVKILPPPMRGNFDLERRLLTEAVTMARVSHPGVPTILDFGHDPAGSAFLVMEYIDGDTLAAHLARGVRFSLGHVIEIGAQVAAALAAAHVSGVVHRDLQPDSIHLCPAPDVAVGFRSKLVNFSAGGSLLESAHYLAPEQTYPHAGPSADARSDIYSLGCVLFELMTGAPPFRGSIDEVLQARRYLEPPPPRAFRPDVPPAIDQLVHRMIARHPADRPASMADVERELRSIAQGAARPQRRLSRPLIGLLAGIAVGLAIGLLLLHI